MRMARLFAPKPGSREEPPRESRRATAEPPRGCGRQPAPHGRAARLTGIYGVEGLDIVQWSRHLRPETRVVLLTGNGTPEIEAEARRRGADAFLHKPLPLPQLEAVVDAVLGTTP